jgi:hypothetical protein
MLTKAGLPLAGWIILADLIPVQQATVRLFDEPLGDLVQTVTGRIDVLAKVATWAKVKVTPPDGSAPTVGWTEDVAGAPVATDPGKPAGPPAADPGVGPAPSGDDLVLGANERYREALLQAQSITSIDAAALAALIDAEAAKIGGGADAGVWDAKSSNASTSASGLTQFLEGTWCEMACRPGKVLNKAARQKGMVTSKNQVAPNMREGLLALRFDPTMSIVTGAEYGLDNLNALIRTSLSTPTSGTTTEPGTFISPIMRDSRARSISCATTRRSRSTSWSRKWGWRARTSSFSPRAATSPSPIANG